MQADDVRALRQSAVPTAAVGVLCAVVGGLVSGEKGVLGAALALLMVTAMVSYLVKVVALAVITAQFKDTTLFNGRVFGFTAIACVLMWCATQVRTWMRTKMFYVEPASQNPVLRDPVGKL